eukprot:746156-Hanusia_phi.AAC.4
MTCDPASDLNGIQDFPMSRARCLKLFPLSLRLSLSSIPSLAPSSLFLSSHSSLRHALPPLSPLS